MPGAVLLKMKLVCRAKESWFGAPPKAITRLAPKARKGMPGGPMATPEGAFPTETVATTVLVAVSITETVPGTGPKFVTYASLPSGVMATPRGKDPTGTVATTMLVAMAITETVPEGLLFVT